MGLSKYTRQELISEALRFEEEFNELPSYISMQQAKGYPPISAYIKEFRLWSNLLDEAPFKNKKEIEIRKKYSINNFDHSKEFLISEALRFKVENDRIPTKHDLMVEKGYPSFFHYENVFGSWTKFLKETFDYVPANCVRYTKEELKLALKRFYNENGRIPQKREFTASSGYPCYSLYLLEFGSWNNAIKEEFGFVPQRLVSLTKDGIKNKFQAFYKENRRIPGRDDLKDMGMTYQQIKNTYGSITNAINDIHFEGSIDPHFFSPENMSLWKWYIVGYIIADGNIYHNYLTINTNETDKDNLYAMYKYMEFDTSFLEVKGAWTEQYDQKYYRIAKSCKQWVEDLELYGIVPKKAKIAEMPIMYINTKEEAAAICRGIFDGDGSINFAYRKEMRLNPIFTISGSEKVCDDYCHYLKKYCGITCNVQECKLNFKIAVEGNACKKIYKFLYGHENFYIKRKKERFEQLVNGTFTEENDPYHKN